MAGMNMHQPGTQRRLWEYRVRAMLADGWGVEDIAVLFEADINSIRTAARSLRSAGAFKAMFKKAIQSCPSPY